MEKICFLCHKNGAADPLDSHHAFGGGLRAKSEKYGLKVWLCHNSCHIFGPKAVHKCAETRLRVQRHCQRKAMKEQGWTVDDFIREFGHNYFS